MNSRPLFSSVPLRQKKSSFQGMSMFLGVVAFCTFSIMYISADIADEPCSSSSLKKSSVTTITQCSQSTLKPIELMPGTIALSLFSKEKGIFKIVILQENDGFRTVCGVKRASTGYSSLDPAFNIETVKENGVNTLFRVRKPAGYTATAIKYPLLKTGEQVVYTPYSDFLLNDETVNTGFNFLVKTYQEVMADVGDIPSKTFPKKTIAEVFEDYDLQSIIPLLAVIEHMDTGVYFTCEGDPIAPASLHQIQRKQIEQALSLYAVNTVKTYAYARSAVSAGGSMQMYPKTMELLQARYPDANLTTDIQDIKNSMKGAILHIDMELKYLAKYIDTHPETDAFGILAAGYNSNAATLVSRIQKNKVPEETQMYIQKSKAFTEWLRERN